MEPENESKRLKSEPASPSAVPQSPSNPVPLPRSPVPVPVAPLPHGTQNGASYDPEEPKTAANFSPVATRVAAPSSPQSPYSQSTGQASAPLNSTYSQPKDGQVENSPYVPDARPYEPAAAPVIDQSDQAPNPQHEEAQNQETQPQNPPSQHLQNTKFQDQSLQNLEFQEQDVQAQSHSPNLQSPNVQNQSVQSQNLQHQNLQNQNIQKQLHQPSVRVSGSQGARLIIVNRHSPLLSNYLDELQSRVHGPVTEVLLANIFTHEFGEYQHIHICIAQSSEFEQDLQALSSFLDSGNRIWQSCQEVFYHVVFDEQAKWADAAASLTDAYSRFLDALEKIAADKVVHCSLINKYDSSVVYLTGKDELVALGQEMQNDIRRWPKLRILDYGKNCLRIVPGVTFPDSLQVLNIGGGFSLETLAGFKMPPSLKALVVADNRISSIDYVVFPSTLEKLDLRNNAICSLNYVEFPFQLAALDVSENRIDHLKNVHFPRSLTHLSVSNNPIECIKGVRFPESVEYLDVSCIPNESMTGIKFPDKTESLNLQSSMTSTRGLKLPPYVKNLNLACNGVNSINPLKLPNSIERLFLANNNIKTLNKVAFPGSLREIYLGNNMITTLKNVSFPPTLEVLDMEMDPHLEENEKYLTSLKDVLLPANLRVLKLGYHSIKSVESMELPYNLEKLSLQYNDLRVFRNIKFGPKLRSLDLSGNQELMSLDNVYFPESLTDLKIPSLLLNNLPANIVERANRKELTLTKSLPYTV